MMNKILKYILATIILTLIVFVSSGCTNTGENSENATIKNEHAYPIISDPKIKNDHGGEKNEDEIQKITTAIIMIINNTAATKQDTNQDNKLINTYEELINSETIKKDIEKKYGSVNNVELKLVEDSDMIKATYVCDKHTDEECKQILREFLSKFSEKLKEKYNIENVYTIDEPEISSKNIE